MLRFKKFITEEQPLLIEAVEEVNWLVFNEHSHIPLSKKMMVRLQGESTEKYGIHITNADRIDDLIRIQNSARQISVMTTPRGVMKDLLKGGIATTGGVWTIVHGYPVLESGSDFWSLQDNQGRRWIRISNLLTQAKRSTSQRHFFQVVEKLHELFHELKREIMLSAVKKFPKDLYMRNFAHIYKDDNLASEKAGELKLGNYQGSYIDEEWVLLNTKRGIPMTHELAAELKMQVGKPFEFGGVERPELVPDKKTKGWIVRQWYDGAEKIMKKGFLDEIQKMMMQTDEDEYGSWNEISMNEFEVVLIGATKWMGSVEIELMGNSAGIPVDAMYSKTAERPKDKHYENLVIELRAQEYFKSVQNGTVDQLVNSAVPPSERIPAGEDLAEKIKYVDADLDHPELLMISLGGEVMIPTWKENVNLEQIFGIEAIEETSADPLYKDYSGYYEMDEYINPFQYQLIGIDKGVSTSIFRPTNATKKAFVEWMFTAEKNTKYNLLGSKDGGSHRLFAYGIAIALGMFTTQNMEEILGKATDRFIEYEDPDYKPSVWLQSKRGI